MPTAIGGELHVRRGPRPQQLDRGAVSFGERDELHPAGLDGGDLLAVELALGVVERDGRRQRGHGYMLGVSGLLRQ